MVQELDAHTKQRESISVMDMIVIGQDPALEKWPQTRAVLRHYLNFPDCEGCWFTEVRCMT